MGPYFKSTSEEELVLGRVSSTQHLDIYVFPGAAKATCFPMVLSATDIDTGPCHCVAKNPDIDLRSSLNRHFTMVSDRGSGYSKEAIPFHPGISSSTLLKIPQTIQLLFLSHLSTTYLQCNGSHYR